MCFSRDSNEAQQPARPMQIGGPQDVRLQIPRPRLDDQGIPIQAVDYELDRQTLEQALQSMAGYLRSRNVSLTVIAIGGVVNTIFLQTRQSTHDVDVLGTNLNNQELRLLDEAAHYAERNSATPLGSEWFNTQTTMWLGPNLHRDLTNAAFQQNDVVFESPGLRVLAAPWDYAFCAKVQRLLNGQPRPYDIADAATYLRHHIERNSSGNRPLTVGIIEEWARRYGRQTDRNFLLRNVNAEYRRRYGADGIIRR